MWSKFCTEVKPNHNYTWNRSTNLCNMNWESTMLLNVFSDLPTYFLQQCSQFSLFLAHLYHRDTKLHHHLGAVSLKWKVPPLLQYPYNYYENCYMLLQQLNDLSQLFDAMAPMCSKSRTCFTAPTESSLNAEAKIMNGYCLCCYILPWGSFVFICTPCPHS